MLFRLFNYGIGIHLLECNSPNDVPEKKGVINPKDNHISFECSDMRLVMRKLEEMNIEYVTAVVEEGGVKVDQLFFHDPDGYMVEICNCQNLPVLPLSSCPLKKLPYSNKENHVSPLSGEFSPASCLFCRNLGSKCILILYGGTQSSLYCSLTSQMWFNKYRILTFWLALNLSTFKTSCRVIFFNPYVPMLLSESEGQSSWSRVPVMLLT